MVRKKKSTSSDDWTISRIKFIPATNNFYDLRGLDGIELILLALLSSLFALHMHTRLNACSTLTFSIKVWDEFEGASNID